MANIGLTALREAIQDSGQGRVTYQLITDIVDTLLAEVTSGTATVLRVNSNAYAVNTMGVPESTFDLSATGYAQIADVFEMIKLYGRIRALTGTVTGSSPARTYSLSLPDLLTDLNARFYTQSQINGFFHNTPATPTALQISARNIHNDSSNASSGHDFPGTWYARGLQIANGTNVVYITLGKRGSTTGLNVRLEDLNQTQTFGGQTWRALGFRANLLPITDNAGVVGDASNRWNEAHFGTGGVGSDGHITIANSYGLTSNLVRPRGNNQGSLGQSSQYWDRGYIRRIDVGTGGLYVQGIIQSPNSDSYPVTARIVRPHTDSSGSLGQTNRFFANAYISTITIRGALVSNSTNSVDIGSTTSNQQITNIYFKGRLRHGSTDIVDSAGDIAGQK